MSENDLTKEKKMQDLSKEKKVHAWSKGDAKKAGEKNRAADGADCFPAKILTCSKKGLKTKILTCSKKVLPCLKTKIITCHEYSLLKENWVKKRYSPRMPPMMQVKIVANTWRLAEQEGKPSVNCNQCKTPGHQYKTPSVLCNQCETLPSHEISSSVKPNPPSSGLFFSWKVLILQRS